MKKVMVVSRSFLKDQNLQLVDENHWNLISISTSGDKPLNNIPKCFFDYIQLEFDDVEIEHDNFTYFNKNHATEILDFINKYLEDNINILVHCDAGISRSTAIAKWLENYGKFEIAFVENPPMQPNQLVKSLMNEVSGLNDEYREFWHS